MRLLISCLLSLLLLGLPSAQAEPFEPGEPHKSHLDFRQYFETMTAQFNTCTISFQKQIYDENQAAKVYAAISQDIAELAALQELQPHTVYVVEKLPAGLQRIDNMIYCTSAQMMDGSYRPWLAAAALGVEEHWRAVGLAAYAFQTEVDLLALQTWYAQEKHGDMLSLFPAYFVDAFASPEEKRMAEQTAAALIEYMIRKDGIQAGLADEVSVYVQPWLTSLGIERSYADPYQGLLDDYRYTHNQYYALIATSPKGDVFKMNPIAYDMSTPALARRVLCELELSVDAILKGVEQDAPEYYPVLKGNYEPSITYEFNEDYGYSLTQHGNRYITLWRASTITHETAHIMVPCRVERISRAMEQWKAEAIAEYLSTTYRWWIGEQEMALKIIKEGEPWPSKTEDERAFWKKWAEVYLRYAPMPECAEDIQMKQWNRANLLAAQELDVAVYTVSGTYGRTGSAQLDAMNGNELSYVEAEWLASYLINRKGLSAFLRFCLDETVTFEDAFDMTYPDAKAEWLENRTMADGQNMKTTLVQ